MSCVAGLAAAGSGDYERVVTDLSFGPRTTEQVVNIGITNDDILEFDENFSSTLVLVLMPPVDRVNLNPDRATITIVDNDSK